MPKNNNNNNLNLRAQILDYEKSIIDIENRSIRTVASTENPAIVFDWSTLKPIREILLMSGVEIPVTKKVPLLNCHSRFDTSCVKGSFQNIRVENNELVGDSIFSKKESAEEEWIDARDGHLDSVSIGYRVYKNKTTIINPGETKEVNGKVYSNDYQDDMDLVIREKWKVDELSLVPIGADDMAKFREMYKETDKLIDTINIRKGVAMPKENENNGTQTKTQDVNNDSKRSTPENDNLQIVASQKEAEEARKQGELDALKRVQEIDAMIDLSGVSHETTNALREKALKENTSLIDFKNELLDAKRSEMEKNNNVGIRIDLKTDEKDSFHRLAVDSTLIRIGKLNDEKRAEDVRKSNVNGSPHNIMRELLIKNGVSATDVIRMSPTQLVDNCLRFSVTSDDLTGVYLDAANKAIGTDFSEEVTDFQYWTSSKDVSDFKPYNSVSVSHIGDWEKMLNGQPFNLTKRSAKYEYGSLETYGKAISISRQDLINDDLNVLSDMAQALGAGGARALNDKVYEVLTSNTLAGPTMNEDSKALFHTDHLNIKANSGVIDFDSLTESNKLLKDIKKPDPDNKSVSRRMGLPPSFVLAGTDREVQNERYFTNPYESSVANNLNQNTPNVWYNRIKRVYSPRLQDLLDTASKANAWYMMSKPLLEVLYLDGMKTPTVRRADAAVGQALGIIFDGYFDFGVYCKDWRFGVYNDGVEA